MREPVTLQRHEAGSHHGASARPPVAPPDRSSLAGLLEEILGDRLEVAVRTWEGFTIGPKDAAVTIVVRSPDAIARVLQRPGQLGFARAFVVGDLDAEGDLVAGLSAAGSLDGIRPRLSDWLALARLAGPSVLVPRDVPAEEAHLSGRRHSLGRDRGAVSHHYDLSNEFYRLLLGPSMTYSCAVFSTPQDSLEDAQRAKHELVARKLDLAPGMRLLDVGCGWGAMVELAASRYGADAVGVTLSRRQRELAAERLATFDGVEIRLQDYRLVDDGPFDAISSIGMSEHVGSAKLPEYFAKLYELVRPGGRVLNHAISSLPAGRLPARWPTPLPRALQGRREDRRGVLGSDSFVGRYIFPDGELVEVGRVVSAMQQAGFEVRHVESLREHYPLTLRRWLAHLEEHFDEAVALVGERRARAWRLYLAGSAVSFDTGRIAVHQVLAVRPEAGRSGMPLRGRFDA